MNPSVEIEQIKSRSSFVPFSKIDQWDRESLQHQPRARLTNPVPIDLQGPTYIANKWESNPDYHQQFTNWTVFFNHIYSTLTRLFRKSAWLHHPTFRQRIRSYKDCVSIIFFFLQSRFFISSSSIFTRNATRRTTLSENEVKSRIDWFPDTAARFSSMSSTKGQIDVEL